MIADIAPRLAALDDAVGIATLSRDAIERGLPWRWQPDRVRRAIQSCSTNVVVAGPPGALAAFGIMSYTDDQAHLLLLAVRESHRRQGLGSAVLQWLESVARAAGAQRIHLEARRDNAAARNFYSEHGYHERHIEKALYSPVVDGLRLEKWLRSDSG
jgi:[ribosomal protein S18]-alanine N-acetyltransferase